MTCAVNEKSAEGLHDPSNEKAGKMKKFGGTNIISLSFWIEWRWYDCFQSQIIPAAVAHLPFVLTENQLAMTTRQ
jgi:hypothetical protein